MWWLEWLVGESFTSMDFNSKDPFFRIQWSRLTQWDLDFKNNLPDQTNTDFRIYDLVGAEPIWGENCAIDLKEHDKEGQPGNLKLCWAARMGNLVHVLKTRQYWSSHCVPKQEQYLLTTKQWRKIRLFLPKPAIKYATASHVPRCNNVLSKPTWPNSWRNHPANRQRNAGNGMHADPSVIKRS